MADERTTEEVAAALAKAQAEAAEAAAAARSAETKALKDAREELEASTPAAIKRREATADQQAETTAREAAAERREELTGLVPDLSKADFGGTEFKGEDQPFLGSTVAYRALQRAAEAVASAVKAVLPTDSLAARVLVTSDPKLANADAIYLDVSTGLTDLAASANELLGKTDPNAIRPQSATALLGVLAAALPQIVTLMSSKRTVTSASATPSDLAAGAATAGQLIGSATVVHDDFRLVPNGGLARQATELANLHRQLVARRIGFEATRSTAAAAQATTTQEMAAKLAELSKADTDASAIKDELKRLRDQFVTDSEKLDAATTRSEVVKTAVDTIGDALTALRARAEGGGRSLLSAAALYEQLHEEVAGGGFSHALLVKAEKGSVQGQFKDRKLRGDKVSVAADSVLTYMLLEAPGGTLAASGTVQRVVTGVGTLGDKLTFSFDEG